MYYSKSRADAHYKKKKKNKTENFHNLHQIPESYLYIGYHESRG